MFLLMIVSVLCSTLLPAFIERYQEVRGVPKEKQTVSIDSLGLIIALSVTGTTALIYLTLSAGIVTVYDLGTLCLVTIYMWAILTKIGAGPWIMGRLIKGPAHGSKPTP